MQIGSTGWEGFKHVFMLGRLILLAERCTTRNWKDPLFGCFLPSWMLDLNDVANAQHSHDGTLIWVKRMKKTDPICLKKGGRKHSDLELLH